MRQVNTAFVEGRVISLARKYSIHGDFQAGSVETLTVGAPKGNTKCRLYDKLAECAGSSGKIELMKDRVWGGVIPESCVRCEFQVRREKLVELKLSSLSDVLGRLSFLTSYLTRRWLRFTDSTVDRTNTTRAKGAGFWDDVDGAFAVWSAEYKEAEPSERPVGKTSADKMVRQAIGCLQRAWAELGAIPADAGEACHMLVGRVARGVADFREGVVSKAIQNGGINPLDLEKWFSYASDGAGSLADAELVPF